MAITARAKRTVTTERRARAAGGSSFAMARNRRVTGGARSPSFSSPTPRSVYQRGWMGATCLRSPSQKYTCPRTDRAISAAIRGPGITLSVGTRLAGGLTYVGELGRDVGVRIEPFDPKTASREAWARYHVFRRVRHAEEDPEDPLNSDAQEEALMKRDDPEGDDLIRVAVDPATGAYVGVLWFSHFFEASPSYATNGHIAWTGVGVILPHRRRGVGTALLRLLPDLARAYKVTQLFGWAQEEDGKAFLRAVGADIGSYRRENRLDLDLVDWPMVERWAREGAARSPDTILRWFRNRIDDDVIVPYAKVYTEVGNQQPRDRLELGDFIITPDLLREKADRLASFGAT